MTDDRTYQLLGMAVHRLACEYVNSDGTSRTEALMKIIGIGSAIDCYDIHGAGPRYDAIVMAIINAKYSISKVTS